jgi:hypothetical protein
LTRIRTAVAVLVIALPFSVAVAGCGGGSSSNNEDPQQVLDETFNNPTKITSGKLDVSLSGSAQGDQSGDFSASISGPFQTDPNDDTAFPQLDLTANVSGSAGGPSLSFDGSLIATKDNAYVEYQDQAYEVGTDVFKRFATAYAQSAKQNQSKSGGSVLSRFGVDPSAWLTNITNEGTTDVDGTDTIQIHGDADVPQIVSDLQKISQATGSSTAQQLTPQQVDQLKSSVKDASIDVYSGTDDHLLRKLAVSLSIAPPASSGATVSSVDADFSVTLSDVNQPQTITAPSNPKPISDLLGQFGLPGLPGAGSGTGGFTFPGSGGSGGSGGTTNPSYLKCVQQAKTPDDISACAQKLQ